ncbi:hypothetical protein EJ04DRAFT_529983 [Polyplosphaeria fusca]|uniref:Uncharacterized protein n=1 Tax=Polyplosphaeria fusca TaxID=682080 RepID=A0A9P4QL63_9PLEO|nr:hypothetical protein EJ04DRAFT_529983 [Polyplosphaeria fusca]
MDLQHLGPMLAAVELTMLIQQYASLPLGHHDRTPPQTAEIRSRPECVDQRCPRHHQTKTDNSANAMLGEESAVKFANLSHDAAPASSQRRNQSNNVSSLSLADVIANSFESSDTYVTCINNADVDEISASCDGFSQPLLEQSAEEEEAWRTKYAEKQGARTKPKPKKEGVVRRLSAGPRRAGKGLGGGLRRVD